MKSKGNGMRRALDERAKISAHVNVGFLEKSKYPDGVPVATVAAENEFGTSRMPSRPFMRNSLRNNRDKYNNVLNGIETLTQVAMKTRLKRIGIVAVSDIQKEIVDLRTPPNADATIKAKGSSNPLIDTGFMRQSVDYEVKDGQDGNA